MYTKQKEGWVSVWSGLAGVLCSCVLQGKECLLAVADGGNIRMLTLAEVVMKDSE
jgi:hypothetical protein